jgi:hypothetical protein
MNNNKNLIKSRDISNAEFRKMEPKDNANVGLIDGQKITSEEKYTKRSKLSHNK